MLHLLNILNIWRSHSDIVGLSLKSCLKQCAAVWPKLTQDTSFALHGMEIQLCSMGTHTFTILTT